MSTTALAQTNGGVIAVTPKHQRGEVFSACFVVAHVALVLALMGVRVLAQITDFRTA
jgi:hypothetical protein